MSNNSFKYTCLALLFVLPMICFSQEKSRKTNSLDIDSSKSKIKKTVEYYYSDFKQLSIDSNRVNLYRLISLAQTVDDKKGQVEIYKLLGYYYHIKGVGDSSIKYYQRALVLGKEVDYKKYFPDISYSLANKFWETSSYSQALELSLLLKDFYEKEGTIESKGRVFNLLGLIYSRLLDYPSALENFQHAVSITEKTKNKALLGVIHTNIGNLYFKQGKYVEALEYFEKGAKLEKYYKQYSSVGRSYEILSRIYLALENPDRAKVLLDSAIFYNEKSSDNIGYSRTYVTYGKLNNHLKNYSKAIDYLGKAEDFATKSDSKESLMDAYEQFTIAYQSLGDYRMALQYHSKFFELYKTIFNIQDYGSIKRLEDELRIEKKNSELTLMKFEKQQYINILLIIAILLFVTVSILFIIMYLSVSRSRKSLIIMNDEIQNQKLNLEKVNVELISAKQEAENANKIKSHFLRNISHEIRTPLNGIVGLSEIIGKENVPPLEKQNYLYMIQNNSNQLIVAIENLVELAHITTNQVQTNIATINPNEFVDEIYQLYSPRFENCKGKITFNYKKNGCSDKCIKTDGNLLKKIVVQLLENAIKFTKEGDISIGYESKDQIIRFFISDTGIGISESSQSLIFESFRQEQESLSREYEGVGIGLTIAKKLSELLDADLNFESKKDQGTTFYLTFHQVTCQ